MRRSTRLLRKIDRTVAEARCRAELWLQGAGRYKAGPVAQWWEARRRHLLREAQGDRFPFRLLNIMD